MSASSAPLAVITGTTHGIGRVTSRELARAGYRVLMLCRNLPAAQLVCEEIRARVPGAEVDSLGCDLASLASVRQSAAQLRRVMSFGTMPKDTQRRL